MKRMKRSDETGCSNASLQFTLNPKCMCAKRDWAEQLARSNKWLFGFFTFIWLWSLFLLSCSTGRVSILTSVYRKRESYCERAWLVIQIYADFEGLGLLTARWSQTFITNSLSIKSFCLFLTVGCESSGIRGLGVRRSSVRSVVLLLVP